MTTAQIHSTQPKFRFCAGSNPARGMLEIRDIMLSPFRWSTTPQTNHFPII